MPPMLKQRYNNYNAQRSDTQNPVQWLIDRHK